MDQLLGTFTLVLTVSAITDNRHSSAPHGGLVPLLVGLIVVTIGLCMGLNCGYAINPARDLGPRIFTSFLYGKNVFTGNFRLHCSRYSFRKKEKVE